MRGLGVRWVLVAGATHGIVLALLMLVAPARTPAAGSTPEPPVRAEFDLEPSALEADPAPAIANASPTALAVTRATTRAPRDTPSATPSDSAAPASSTSSDFDRPLNLSGQALGMDRRSALLGELVGAPGKPPSEAVPERNEAPGIEQSVRDALQDRDRDLGLGAAGPIVGVAEAVARASTTPWNSRATFEVVTDATGAVTTVRLIRASEAWGDWERVASDLRTALRRLALHVPPGAAGVEATLEVTSRLQLPSGHDPDTEVTVFGVPVKKAPPTSKQPMRVDILKPDLKIVDVAPSPDLGAPIKLPEKQLVIGVTILGLVFDPTDLTPRPLRVVHARITREHVL
jgi:hypothetical protein